MGNNHSQENVSRAPTMSRSSSAKTLAPVQHTQIVPIDKLAKILVEKSLQEESVNGITCRVFINYVFPHYPDLAERLFTYFHSRTEKTTREWISYPDFCIQADQFVGVINDGMQIKIFLKVYAEDKADLDQEDFRNLLVAAHKLAMDFYPDHPPTCIKMYQTLQCVVEAAFHRKSSVSLSYLGHWVEQHCPRLLTCMYRYVVHVLSTAYRSVGQAQVDNGPVGMELSTPVLEREMSFTAPPEEEGEETLPLSQVWLLATTLSPLYTKPSQHVSPSSSAVGLSSQTFVAKMLGSVCPSHWVQIYDSNQHGLGANRFLHHVLNYRSPSLLLLRGQEGSQFCVAASTEWRESHQYWGGEESCVLQMAPRYHVVERGAKMLYLNTSIRGYPKGIRAGLDPRKPVIDVNEGFTVVTYQGIPYPLISVEVWGCGTPQSRDSQLDLKKWQVRQAEKQRQVKISASDWVDHPDRYLLELAGRASYNADNNAPPPSAANGAGS